MKIVNGLLLVVLGAANIAEYAYLRDSWSREATLRADLDRALQNNKKFAENNEAMYKNVLSENESFKKMNALANECVESLNQCTAEWKRSELHRIEPRQSGMAY